MSTRRLCSLVLGLFLFGTMTLLTAAPTKEEKEVEKHTQTLKSGKNAKEKVEALKELGRLGAIQVSLTTPAVPEIMKALDDKEATVRAAAAYTIGKIDPEDKKAVVEKLTKMLKEDKSETAKEGAANGLGAIGPEARSAAPALREAMAKAGKKGGQAYQRALLSITGKKK